jgi:folate-binding protein YgfZ
MKNFCIGSRIYDISPEFYLQPEPNLPFYVELKHFGIIHVKGEKAESFLQGQLTNDLSQATETKIQKQLLCNIKGQLITTLLLVKNLNQYQLICPKDLILDVINILQKTAQLSRVTLETNLHSPIYGVISAETIHKKEIIPLENQSYLSFIHPEFPQKEEIFWHYHQLKNNHFSIYPETSKLFLPHHIQLESAGWISFNKGCYRGQEIIARMHYRGKSKYQLEHLIKEQEQEQKLQPGSALLNDENQKLGEIIDLCPINDKQLLIVACRKIL